ncbi:diguanylate cyclase domain-containing protein [Paraburkholderia sp. ZP32-5]|uniref:diguanylate cyclase domain-containing protein n=1 Tax=Paraburkholderia sp. ZP32-5 TaxID=2883245 RepID=UPI001F270780|nr:GGDEF domain-containing protein [Paraburkholderia sp. ZP32-5]
MGPTLGLRPGPATIAVAALLCLLVGVLYLAMQVRTVFSDQVKQEYAGLVLEAADRAASAREQLNIWQRIAGAASGRDPAIIDGYNRARAEFTRRFASLAALVNASPSADLQDPPAKLNADLSPDAAGAALASVSAYWRAQRDAYSSDARVRVTHVAHTLIALAALLFCMLITALGMYAKRNRQLAGQSHEFEHASLHDSLTGLPNRRRLLAALDEAAANARDGAAPSRIAVLYVDLDGFKQVNDSFGHPAGDAFLTRVATCFRASVRKTDLVARIGGDEFAVLVRAFSNEMELADIARRLIGCVVFIDEQMEIGHVRASVGIASYPDAVGDHRRLVAAADEAMYQVKRDGKNGYAFAARAGRTSRTAAM